jgi:signal transduction histidine kinase/DNA-binding response OmpR family regulator
MNQPSILVIDDERNTFNVIAALWPKLQTDRSQNRGYTLHYAADEQAAIAALKSFQPDVIVLNVMTPGFAGLEVCRRIKAMPQGQAVPIMMMTALTPEADLARCLEARVNDPISPPVSGVERPTQIDSRVPIQRQCKDLPMSCDRQTGLECEKVELLERYNTKLEQQVEERTAALKATLEREQLVAKIAIQIQSSLHLQEILETTVQEVRLLLGCDHAVIWQFQPDWSAIAVAKAAAPDLVCIIGQQVHDPHFGRDWLNLYAQGRVRVVPDVYTAEISECHRKLLLKAHIRAKILVPILQGDHLWGLLSVAERLTPRQWQPEETTLLQQLATQLAIAIQNACLFEQVRDDRERLQALSSRLIEAQELERRHIAYELHDEIGQVLTAVKINLQALQRSLKATADPHVIQENITIVDGAMQHVRNLALDLRPSLLDDLGLLAALRWYLDRQSQRTGIPIGFVCEAFESVLLPQLETVCFRIVQEALTNITKHAKAKHVTVRLNLQDDELSLTIRDDGIGFDVQIARERAARGSSLGLLGMEERAALVGGQLKILSRLGHGTETQVHFPIHQSALYPG